MTGNRLTVAVSPTACAQEKEIAERMYIISDQDYTEVVGVLAREVYENSVRRFYVALERQPHLSSEGDSYGRLRLLGRILMQEAKTWEVDPTQTKWLSAQRSYRA